METHAKDPGQSVLPKRLAKDLDLAMDPAEPAPKAVTPNWWPLPRRSELNLASVAA